METVSLMNQNKTLAIGAGWNNKRNETNDVNKPIVEYAIDSNLGINITLTPGARLQVYINQQYRPGTQDPEYRLAVLLPADIANREIERQRTARQAVVSQETATMPAAPVVPATPAMPEAPAVATMPAMPVMA